jgi:DNA-binding beta-propeller fold protein YncE
VVLPGGDTILSTMAGYSAAILFDAGSGEPNHLIELTQVPDAAVYDPVTKLVWVLGRHGLATAIDPALAKAVGQVALGDQLEFAAVDGAGRLFVNVVNKGEIAVVDTRTRTARHRFKMTGCEEPTGLAYVATYKLLISVCSNGVAKVLDAATGTEVASLQVGEDADAVIYDADRRLAFIPSAKDGTLSVLAVRGANDIRVVERDVTQMGTRTGAIDAKTGLLYLPTARFGPKNKLGWPEPLPGSVELLVLAPR